MSWQDAVRAVGLLTLIRVNRGSREKVLGEGHISHIHLPLSFVLVGLECRRVHHSCVIWNVCCLCATHHVDPTLHIMHVTLIVSMMCQTPGLDVVALSSLGKFPRAVLTGAAHV